MRFPNKVSYFEGAEDLPGDKDKGVLRLKNAQMVVVYKTDDPHWWLGKVHTRPLRLRSEMRVTQRLVVMLLLWLEEREGGARSVLKRTRCRREMLFARGENTCDARARHFDSAVAGILEEIHIHLFYWRTAVYHTMHFDF